jgi:pilus assembly protein Flp/PilA
LALLLDAECTDLPERVSTAFLLAAGLLQDEASSRERGVPVSIQSFFREDDGQGLVEYALIIAVIAIAVIVAMVFLRGQIQNIFSNIGNNLT